MLILFIRNSFIRNLVVASSIKKLLLLQYISTFGIRNFFYFLQKNNSWLEVSVLYDEWQVGVVSWYNKKLDEYSPFVR